MKGFFDATISLINSNYLAKLYLVEPTGTRKIYNKNTEKELTRNLELMHYACFVCEVFCKPIICSSDELKYCNQSFFFPLQKIQPTFVSE